MPNYSASFIDVETGNDLQYQFFAVNHESTVVRVKALNDAHIALATEHQDYGPMYEVIFGCSGNTKTVIRKNRIPINHVQVNTPEILNAAEYREFWIKWHNGIIYAGRKDESFPFISWLDPEPFRIFFVGICTGYGVSGSWQIEDIRTYPSPKYQFYPVANGLFEFQVKAAGDAYVVLTEGPELKEPFYEVKIGGWKNTKSALKRNFNAVYEVEKATPSILTDKEYHKFWIKWSCGDISLGKEGLKADIFTWSDRVPFPIFYVGISTPEGNGRWKFNAPRAQLRALPYVGESSIWVDAQDGQVPIGAVVGGHEGGEPLYVARVVEGKSMKLGKLKPSIAAVILEGHEVKYQYQVLVRLPSNTWFPVIGSNIPAGAYPGGVTEDGDPLYIGRVIHKDRLIIGKVLTRGVCCVSIGGQEVEFSRYEILMTY